ncbi:uncharacterized protein [Primulina eburnea]|uniref:uncharacterized protein n=1 Tax=Primulina eburnea TaxID=1245227 RepID=UPI003C6C7835
MAPLCLYSTGPAWPQRNHTGIRNHFSICNCTPRARSLISSSDTRKMGVFVLSDLHTDYSDNMSWVRSLKSRSSEDVLLVAGDVAETCSNFVLTMSLLKDEFHRVFFVPGNHDLWLRREKADHLGSLDKLDKLLDACERLGVETTPGIVDGLGVIPLYSWYHESFDGERDITGVHIPSLEMACKDFHICKWPDDLKKEESSLAKHFDDLNDKNWDVVEDIQKRCSHIISFSHFVPRQELCPEKRMLFYPNLPKIIGSIYLENRIRCIHGARGSPSACHVFGHTHFCWDAILDGIRYVQAPLAYPRERQRKMNGGEEWLPFCIYEGGHFAEKHSPCYWSDYYSINPRTPDIIELAPWVARFYNTKK